MTNRDHAPTVRGGYLIARRHRTSGVLIKIGRRQFEHATLAEAQEQARSLAAREGDEFAIFLEVAAELPPEVDPMPDPLPEPVIPSAPLSPAPRAPVIVERRSARRRPAGGTA